MVGVTNKHILTSGPLLLSYVCIKCTAECLAIHKFIFLTYNLSVKQCTHLYLLSWQ